MDVIGSQTRLASWWAGLCFAFSLEEFLKSAVTFCSSDKRKQKPMMRERYSPALFTPSHHRGHDQGHDQRFGSGGRRYFYLFAAEIDGGMDG